MRLDKYLKVSRLIKRRTVANEACDNERVTVNGRVQRASYDVKVGDVISIRFGQNTLTVEVLSVTENVGKDAAAAMSARPRLSRTNCHNTGRSLIRWSENSVGGSAFLCLTT